MAFKLMNEPIAVQITVHVNNLKHTYPDAIETFVGALNGTEPYYGLTMAQLIDYYGVDCLKQWFSEFYGVKFKSEAA